MDVMMKYNFRQLKVACRFTNLTYLAVVTLYQMLAFVNLCYTVTISPSVEIRVVTEAGNLCMCC